MVDKNVGGRPPKLEPDDKTIKFVSGLATIGCTKKEAAAALLVSEPTFHKFLNDHPAVVEAWDMGAGQLAVSLRRKQWKMADKSAAMLIFLGKNILGQVDKIEHSGPNGGPIETKGTVDVAGLTLEQLRALASIKVGE